MLNCVWNITAEEGHFIEITFDDFEVEGPRNDVCTFDYVSIQQGKGPFMAHFHCWTRIQIQILNAIAT